MAVINHGLYDVLTRAVEEEGNFYVSCFDRANRIGRK
ncbi:hypothetical protein JOC78_000608 [Bacillus ectoiniformans]|nr:hypothetical protein [Bacillus ectoiniformans]